MPLTVELLILIGLPVALVTILLIGHLATLRGLRGDQRIEAFRLFLDAARRRR
ncbi:MULTISPECIES: hypothetical protein [unclassified Streptomyces]|uniref:hypothetical protein n=1 Tax=unclassified Streptomyces TaxID=2593676 RepID=UPI00158737A7|nr:MULTISPECIES: hypothetical protein [unclassified Streptomyces]NUV65504.1 hypothetical protein [Streptomyces sp. CAI-121]NUV99465.1 hypothetical protein [Streptomyces sp. CAI 127]NUW12241.1 hypothetical protein [Streptomyces sp. CAI-68]